MHNKFIDQVGVALPVVCGAMYPCSNPELVAAVSEAGGLGVIQPLSLTYVHGYDFREGIRFIRTLTDKPVGMNALIESSSKKYHQQMVQWVNIALEEGVRFFVTSLGKPDWVVKLAHEVGGIVYHDATERKWALKGLDCGVDGLIAVNNRAGGHAGGKSAEDLYQELADFNVPLLSAGGTSTAEEFADILRMGYDGVQMGTRFIATVECNASEEYKNAVVNAGQSDIVLSERITGVPVSIIRTPYVDRVGTRAGPLARWMLKGHRTKRIMRTWYALNSLKGLKKGLLSDSSRAQYWQAGKSVAGIHAIEPVAAILESFKQAMPAN